MYSIKHKGATFYSIEKQVAEHIFAMQVMLSLCNQVYIVQQIDGKDHAFYTLQLFEVSLLFSHQKIILFSNDFYSKFITVCSLMFDTYDNS